MWSKWFSNFSNIPKVILRFCDNTNFFWRSAFVICWYIKVRRKPRKNWYWQTWSMKMGKIDLFCIFLTICVWLDIRLVDSETNETETVVGVSENITYMEHHVQERSLLEAENSSLLCNSNQWLCGGACIHKREYCAKDTSCHPAYPIPCGDEARCYRHVYISFSIYLYGYYWYPSAFLNILSGIPIGREKYEFMYFAISHA